MKTSSKARYALYLVVDIATHEDTGPVSLREVAGRHDISIKFLEQIAGELGRAGYLKSVRGASGGYLLAQDSASITAGDIMRAAEGGFLPVSCLDGAAESCPRHGGTNGKGGCCKMSSFWYGLRTTLDDYLDSVSIASLTT
ncbi:MAG: Rrf2 family transcriptional regulator [Coriobacteriales bacterium]|jgi:Rrf2 family protein|nr:Rrf2 family transcriptional regulator [Coriobacteriales bacterium]